MTVDFAVPKACLAVRCRTALADDLAEAFLSVGPLPAKARVNTLQVANAVILSRLRSVAERLGHRLPVVCTPLQLMGEIEYED